MDSSEAGLLLDDFSDPDRASIGSRWRFFSDRVMGGVSDGYAEHKLIEDRNALRLRGTVSLENNGGFIQASLDLSAQGGTLDASGYLGIALYLRGDGSDYGIHLRTTDIQRPWQSYRARIRSSANWIRYELPFRDFAPHRIDRSLDPRKLRRLGLIAIEKPGAVDVAISDLRLYGHALIF
ncbi:MAG: hypothetical protein ACI87W_001713 [Halieaceae bacterium]|jgi:hypothetical protein